MIYSVAINKHIKLIPIRILTKVQEIIDNFTDNEHNLTLNKIMTHIVSVCEYFQRIDMPICIIQIN